MDKGEIAQSYIITEALQLKSKMASETQAFILTDTIAKSN